ncbi:MAG: PAS domain S-box protein, partial [Prolixibacteraceae bacterium]|nr:PAS domain S-box protein [Prolixibacteraceae bacterium]
MTRIFILNTALLITLSFLYGIIKWYRPKNEIYFQLTSGLWFGLVAVSAMMIPFEYTPGTIYDGRSVVLTLAGLWGGGYVTLLSVIIAGAYRIYLGGAGIWAGLTTILFCGLTGLVFRLLLKNRLHELKIFVFWGIGVVSHVVMLSAQLLVPGQPLLILHKIWLPVIVVFPLAFAFIATLFQIVDRYISNSLKIREAEELYRTTLLSIGDAVICTDKSGAITQMNSVAEKLTGWKFSEARGRQLENVFRIINKHSREKIESPFAKVMKNGTIAGLEKHTLLITKDGREIAITDSGAPIKNNDEITGVVLVFKDITDEYQLLESLRESEEKYRLLVENQTDLVVKVNAAGQFLFVSPSYCTLFGKTEEELLGNTFMPLVHEEDRESTAEAMKALKHPPYTVYIEQRAMTTRGWVWLGWNDTAIVDEHGNIKEIIGVGRDISRRKHDEKTISEHERQLESMVKNLPGFVYRCKYNKDWTMLYLSQQFEKITGYLPVDFIQNAKQTYNNIIEKSFQTELLKKWEKAITQKSVFEAEYPIVTQNNQLKWVWERGTGVFDDNGNVLFLEGYIEDISEWKNAEMALKESEERFRLVLENSLDAILITNPDGSILNANKAACKMFQMTEEEICKAGRKGIVNLNDPNLPKFTEERKKNGYTSGELTFYRKDGSLFLADISSSVYKTRRGELRSSLIIRDITERKKNEAILRESEERFSTAFRASPAPLVISDIESGLFVDVNNRWVEMLGYSKEEQIGKTSKEVGIWRNPSERDRVIQQVLKNGFFKDEYIEFITKNGEVILALWSAETIMHSG